MARGRLLTQFKPCNSLKMTIGPTENLLLIYPSKQWAILAQELQGYSLGSDLALLELMPHPVHRGNERISSGVPFSEPSLTISFMVMLKEFYGISWLKLVSFFLKIFYGIILKNHVKSRNSIKIP